MTADCIDRIVDQKDALTLHFNIASNSEHCYTARLLKEMYDDKTNLFYMYFLQPVLMEIKTVNKCFQLETGVVPKSDSLPEFDSPRVNAHDVILCRQLRKTDRH